MKPIHHEFHKGIQFNPRTNPFTINLRRTGAGKLAYAKNVNSNNDQHPGAITPGPALQEITNNTQLTGVPFAKSFFGTSALAVGYLYFLQGLLGTKNIIRRVKDIIVGFTPSIDVTGSMTATHGGHTNPTLVDIELRIDSSGNPYMYVSGKDDTDTWVYKFLASAASPTLSLIAANASFTGGTTDPIFVLGPDNNLYWIGRRQVDKISTTDVYTTNALADGLPLGTFASAATDWNGKLVVALSTDANGDFDRRQSAGRASVILWDYTLPAFLNSPIPAPCRYISALVVDPSGNLLAFGGVDEGKVTLFEFTGYGFTPLWTYQGDMPRNRHAIQFDGQGRVIWQTVDGQILRFDKSSAQFDYLGTTVLGTSSGGMLAKGIGLSGVDDFFAASGNGTGYTLRRVGFGSFSGDAGVQGITTPLAIDGLQQTPFNATIAGITWHLDAPLSSGQKVHLLVYINGNTTPITYSTLDFAIDGAVSSKFETKTLININNYSLGVRWEMADLMGSAPAVASADVELN